MICATSSGRRPQLPYRRNLTAAPEMAEKPRLCDRTYEQNAAKAVRRNGIVRPIWRTASQS